MLNSGREQVKTGFLKWKTSVHRDKRDLDVKELLETLLFIFYQLISLLFIFVLIAVSNCLKRNNKLITAPPIEDKTMN